MADVDEKLHSVYREKYETFRHFDRLRWGIPPIALGAGSVLLGLASDKGVPYWWALMLFGLLSLLSGFTIARIRKGIEANRIALAKLGEEMGDSWIPKSPNAFGASWWFVVFLYILGAVSLLLSFVLHS